MHSNGIHWCTVSLVPSPFHPSFCLAAMEIKRETKAGVERTGNEASVLYRRLCIISFQFLLTDFFFFFAHWKKAGSGEWV